MKIIASIFALTILTIVGSIVMSFIFSITEISQCQSLQHQANHGYEGHFYITQWQKDMCDAHSLTIDAPVQK